MPEHELIAGLESAVAAAPGNVPLRLHLVEQLIEGEKAVEALAHCEAILRAQPDNLRALDLALRAASAVADPRAAAYQRVASALRLAERRAAPDKPSRRIRGRHAAPPAEEPTPAPAAEAAAPPPPAEPVPATPSPRAQTAPASPAAPAQEGPRASAPPAPPAPEPAPEPVAEPVAEQMPDEPPAPPPFVIEPQMIQKPELTFRNIIGVSTVKQRIQETVLEPIRKRGKNGGAPRGGILMFGPPGCGKGFFARVVAGEIGASFLPVKLSRALEWPGDPRHNIQTIFDAAREHAPCVLFLDEVEWAGRSVEAPDEPIDRGVVARLVTELDTAAANRGVYVFAGADSPWDVDMALRAEGRLDQTLLVLPPDDEAREAILRFHLRERRLAGIDVGWIVQRTQHFSGDDLLVLCETAAALAAEDALGGEVAIGPGHVTRALRDVRPTAPAWFQTAVDRAIAVNHGGMYDDVMSYIEVHQLV